MLVLGSVERRSAALARRVELARLLIEMVAERLDRASPGAGAGVGSQPAACRSLLAQALGSRCLLGSRIGSIRIVQDACSVQVSGSTSWSLSRAEAYEGVAARYSLLAQRRREYELLAEDFERRRIGNGVEGAARKLRVEMWCALRRDTDFLVGFRNYDFHVSFGGCSAFRWASSTRSRSERIARSASAVQAASDLRQRSRTWSSVAASPSARA